MADSDIFGLPADVTPVGTDETILQKAGGLQTRKMTLQQMIDLAEANISHLNISDIGVNTHAQIDTHIADGTIHFTEGSIDHTAIQNIGTNSHAQIDSHIAATNNPHATSVDNLSDTTITNPQDGQALIYQAGSWINGAGAGGGGLAWTLVSINTLMESDNGYMVNSTAAPISMTFPASPAEGDTVGVSDAYGTADTNNITLLRNGSNIMGLAEDFQMDERYLGMTWVYADATRGWIITDLANGNENAGIDASEVTYDNTFSGNPSNNVQGALDNLSPMVSSSGVLAPHKNLVIQNNAGNPTFVVDIDADEVLFTDSANKQIIGRSINLSLWMTINGVSGLGNGVTEQPSTWYHLFLGYGYDQNPTTVYGWLDTDPNGANDPDTLNSYRAYVGAIYNDSGSDLDSIFQINTNVTIGVQTLVSGGSATSYTSVGLSAVVPSTAVQAKTTISAYTTTGSSGATGYLSQSNDAADIGNLYCSSEASVSAQQANGYILLQTTQTMYYKVIGINAEMNVSVTGWEY